MKKIKTTTKTVIVGLALLILPLISFSSVAALSLPVSNFATSQCGSGAEAITTSINFGCQGAACVNNSHASSYCSGNHNALIDLLFAIIRFVTDGIGLVMIVSLIIAGIQYTTSRGDPQELNKATKRIRSTITALIFFLFAYAILNYVVPNGFFGQ